MNANGDALGGRGTRLLAMRLIVGLGIGVLAVWFVVSTAGGLADADDSIRQMRPGWVVVALALSATRIGLYALQLLWLARRSGRMSRSAALGLSLVVFGFGAVTPVAPAEGLALAVRELRRRGRSKQQAWLTLGFSEWFAQRAFYAVTALDLLLVISVGHLAWADSWPFALAGGLVIVLLVATATLARRPATAERAFVVLGAFRLRQPRAPAADRRRSANAWRDAAMATVGPPANRVRLALVSGGAVLADAATLSAACLGAGIHLDFEVVVLAATVGTMASWIPLLPGGLGLVEAVIPVILHRFGAPLADALAATVVYRAAGTLLPALVGALAATAMRVQPASGRDSSFCARAKR